MNSCEPSESLPAQQRAEIESLRDQLAQLQELRENAARYLWLRNEALSLAQVGSFSPYVVKGQIGEALDGEELDSAVDAVRKRENHE